MAHADDLGNLFKFSAEHTCRSVLHSLENFTDIEQLVIKNLTTGFFLNYEHHLLASGCSRNTSACYFRTLRAICRQAELQKLLMNVHHLFNGLFMGYEETRKRALNISSSYSTRICLSINKANRLSRFFNPVPFVSGGDSLG